MCDSIIEHTLNPKHLMEEMHRVLMPGGKVILAVPSANSIRRIWGMIRDRSPFHSLIYNLVRFDFMVKCAVLYSPGDLHLVMDPYFTIDSIRYLDEKHHDAPSAANSICRIVSRFIPRMRDVVILVATKK